MKFGILTEEQLKAASAGRLDRLFELWHRDVQPGGARMDIVLGNRRDSSSPVRGGILTNAVIELKTSGARLMIWYDPLELLYDARIKESGYSREVIDEITEILKEDRDPGPDFDPVANPEKLDFDNIARQIARWLLKFRGYRKLENENRTFFELESFLNLECGIPALYFVLDEAGLGYDTGERKRLVEVYEGLINMEEPSKRVDRALNALRISNILEFSPDCEEKTGLEELVNEKFPRIQQAVDDIRLLKKEFDLTGSDGLKGFMNRFVLKYRLPGVWSMKDETEGLF